MKRFYIINKRPVDKTGKVLSGHKTFELAEKALERIQKQVDGVVPAVIIESEKRWKTGQIVASSKY